jgi:hypothetical protein
VLDKYTPDVFPRKPNRVRRIQLDCGTLQKERLQGQQLVPRLKEFYKLFDFRDVLHNRHVHFDRRDGVPRVAGPQDRVSLISPD